jgi:ATP-dependent Lhr-like helicase
MADISNGFDKLGPEISKVLAQSKLRGKEPTPIQEAALAPIIEGENTMLISQTGTGKTLAVMLPIFNNMLKSKLKPICALYITPLKALNRDLLDRLIWWSNKLGIEIAVRHGDTSQYERKQQLEFPPHILIVTLETLQPLLTGKRIREHLRNIDYVILDEVHETVESKRGIQLSLGLQRLKKLCNDFQMVMLSATIGSPEKVASFYSAGQHVEIVRVDTDKKFDIKVISPQTKANDEDIAKIIFSSKETAARLRTIMELVKGSRSSLTFTNTREFAEILASRTKTIEKDFPAEIHHSSLSKTVRINTEKRFKNEEIKSIICTSSLQLGIDIGTIDLVIQYMSPRRVSQLIQRVGRAGHGIEKVSRGIIIATDDDDCFEASVVARRALSGELEPTKSHHNSLDVLAHQIVGMTIEDWKIGIKDTYETLRKAGPYSTLGFEEFKSVCRQLQQIGVVFLDDHITKKRRGFSYYFSQLSTIPDSKQYRIFNTLDQSFVGVLDDEFVSVHGDPGTTFIVKGVPWRILETEDNRVLVEPSNDLDAAIPGWEGEMIPVHFDIAQEVGRLRAKIFNMLGERSEREIVNELMKEYPIERNVAKKMVKLIKKQKKHDPSMITDDKNILVEDYENVVVINSCFGSVVNDTLGRFISALLSSRVGSVGLKTDPYRIMIQFQQKNMDLVKEALLKTKPAHLRNYLELSLSKSDLFQYRFVHVAKRFGAFSRDAQLGRSRLKSVIEDYVDTPVYKETMKEIETDKLNIEKATEVLKHIQSGGIKLFFKKGLSPIGKIGVKQKYAEVIGPERPTKELFDLFKQRIMNTQTRLACMNCGKWTQVYTIKDMPESVRCPNCDAIMLGIVHPRQSDITKIIQKKMKSKNLRKEEREVLERAESTANLYMTYKRGAAIMLAGRGVGPYTAKKILSRYHENVEDLLKDVLEAEKQWLKTKKYWKI